MRTLVGRRSSDSTSEHVTLDASTPEGQRAAAHIKIGEIEHSLGEARRGPSSPFR
jgi:hypothetical protein